MKKIPFDIKYRPEIESGKYKVVTNNDLPVRIICWDKKGGRPIVALITYREGAEQCSLYPLNVEIGNTTMDHLFILTDEPELTEFETEVCAISNLCLGLSREDEIKKAAGRLLDLARKEITKDLPKWKPIRQFQYAWKSQEEAWYDRTLGALFYKGYKLHLSDLEKLPKED